MNNKRIKWKYIIILKLVGKPYIKAKVFKLYFKTKFSEHCSEHLVYTALSVGSVPRARPIVNWLSTPSVSASHRSSFVFLAPIPFLTALYIFLHGRSIMIPNWFDESE